MTLLVALVIPVSAIVVLAVLAPALLLVLVPLLLALAAVPALLRRHAADDGREVQEALAGISTALVDTVQGLREVVLFDAQDARRTATARAGDRSRRAHRTQARRSGRYFCTVDAVLGIGLLAVLAAAGGAASTGVLAISDVPVMLLGADIREGMRYVRRHPIMWPLTVAGFGASLSNGALLGLLVVYGVRHLEL